MRTEFRFYVKKPAIGNSPRASWI